MHEFLFMIAFWVGLAIIGWLIQATNSIIKRIKRHNKYLAKLRQFEPLLSSMDFSELDEYLHLQSMADSTFSRMKAKYDIPAPKKLLWLLDNIEEDIADDKIVD